MLKLSMKQHFYFKINIMSIRLEHQQKPDHENYATLIHEIGTGVIKIPKFQRDFVWSIDKTAKLLDSILKGYPIGTFILWQTDERINDIKNIGDIELPETKDGVKVKYVLDGQQRITSLYAAYMGVEIQKPGTKKKISYKNIYVNLNVDIDDDIQIISSDKAKLIEKDCKYVSLHEVLNFNFDNASELKDRMSLSQEDLHLVSHYQKAFQAYSFSIVLLLKNDINSAIEVFTRINTGGKVLTLFEIMSAKTYDEIQVFDIQEKWKQSTSRFEKVGYDGISGMIILNLIALLEDGDCKRKTILSLDKQRIIDTWGVSISALEKSIDYFLNAYRIPASRLIPYDSLLVPFAYFFYKNEESQPDSEQSQFLREFFWRISLSGRYSSSTETSLTQDVKRMDEILNGERPKYDGIKLIYDSNTLIHTNFSTGNSFCKAILCLLAYKEPLDFASNNKVELSNQWLKASSSRNYHHFFPKGHLKVKTSPANSNSLMNITLISDSTNKKIIKDKAPSVYIKNLRNQNKDIDATLESHFINIKGFGIETDDYELFLSNRAIAIFNELDKQINLKDNQSKKEKSVDLLVDTGEDNFIEFKASLRYCMNTHQVRTVLEHEVALTIAAFLNTDGGNLLIGISDKKESLGLENDYGTLKKGRQDKDGFKLKIQQDVVKKYIGNNYIKNIVYKFPIFKGKEICHIKVSPSSKPVFIELENNKKEFYIRKDGLSESLDGEAQSAWEKDHPNFLF